MKTRRAAKTKKGSNNSPRISVRFPRPLLQRLRDLARKDERTPSDYMRKVLREHADTRPLV